MRFLFKPSVSYALLASMLILSAIASTGNWVAAIIYLIVSSVIGGILEAVVAERETGDAHE